MEEKTSETKSEESEHESEEDESEILEESPCGRWLKRSEEVSQRNVPGIDRAYLAMDSEEGVEVVWNEVQFSERKSFKQQEEKIKAVFDNLMRIDHANIVKFHRYWIDYTKEQQKTRVVFITEYMSSGSVKEFLNKTKDIHKYKRTKSWKRWCTQILSALSYLHNCVPAVIHGNMTCDTIFIQHNGLVKIGSVAPDAIRNHVKTYHEVKRNMHYYAPEYETAQAITPAVDIYSFGICALEMAVPRSQLSYTDSKSVTTADIERAIDVLDDPHQRDFIRLCLCEDPALRPSPRSLLLHPLLFEVHSLKLLAAHAFVKNQRILPEYKQKEQNKELVIAETTSSSFKPVRLKDILAFDIDKFLEDVMNGVYPLTSYALPKPPWAPPSSAPPQTTQQDSKGHVPSEQADEIIPETRRIMHAQGTLVHMENSYGLVLQLRFEDKMNRHLNCEVTPDESAEMLASELIEHKLIKDVDKPVIKQLLEDGLKGIKSSKAPVHFSSGQLLGTENADDVASVIGPALQPVSQTPLVDNSYLFYPNLQSQMLPKSQPQMSVSVNSLMQQMVSGHAAFPPPVQTITSPPQPLPATIFQSQLLPQGQILSTLPQPQAAIQPSLPTLTPSMDHTGLSNVAFAQQLFPQPSAAVLQQLPFQMQYMHLLQQQASNSLTPHQPANALQSSLAQIQPQALMQAQLVQQQILQQQQALYGQQQHQPMIIQPSQPQAVSQIPVQRHVHFQSVVPTHNISQSVPAMPQVSQPAVVASLLPLVMGQQAPVSAQAISNPAMVQMQQAQARMQVKLTQTGDIQRSTSLFSVPPQQQTLPQTLSSNNSNNTVFTRSISRIEDGNQLGTAQVPSLLQQATPHSSIVSSGSSVSDHDMTNTNKSPPTSVNVD